MKSQRLQQLRISFEEAKDIWNEHNVVLPAIALGEKRFIIIGTIGTHIYSCIYTVRKKIIRIISCRRSRDNERSIYHEAFKE